MRRLRKYIKRSGMIVLSAALITAVLYGVFLLKEGKANLQDPEGVSLIESQDSIDVKAAVEKIRDISETAAVSTEETGTEEQTEETPETETEEASEDTAADPSDVFKTEYAALLDAGTVPALTEEEIAAFRQTFSDTVFFGDSMAQAIAEYGIASYDRTIYLRGGTLDTILSCMDQVQNIYPARIIIWTGLNDCNRFMSDFAAYQQALTDVINAAAGVCGAENVYVCSLLPPSDEMAAVRDDLALAPVYNTYLQETVSSCGVHYIDTTWIVRQNLYLDDGIHMNSTFYAVWARYLMQIM